ncbi:MAG TPA: DUF4410 domain-containing protein [Candidatus Acidoferrales bacterium]|nr:DUF4410 domain-containing protein [Candidatus Acidoferrales bacterium]
MNRRWILLLVGLLFFAATGDAKDEKPRFKTVEIKHFPFAEGVELPPEFSDFLCAALKKELQKTGMFEQIVGEGEVVEAADAPQSLVLEGSILEYKKGSVAKQVIIGFGAGSRSLVSQLLVHRRSDNASVFEKQLKVRCPASWSPDSLARFLAHEIAHEMKHQLNQEPAASAP